MATKRTKSNDRQGTTVSSSENAEATQVEAGKDASVADARRGDVPVTELDAKRQEAEQAKAEEQKERAESVSGEIPEDKVSAATRENVFRDEAADEVNKADRMQREKEVAEKTAEDEKNRQENAKSEASEDQYAVTLAEYEEAAVDMSRPYNARFEARQKADVLRAVIADLKGEGDPSGPTVPSFDRVSALKQFETDKQ